jgi:hypothetical protein
MLWAKSSRAAFRSGAFFATRRRPIALPEAALAYGDQAWLGDQTQQVPARLWFAREPEDMVLTEMTRVAGSYDQTLTLLLMPPAERVWRERGNDDEEGSGCGRRLGAPL